MNELSLVTLIVPCYNAELTLPRLLDSILSQTYDRIQFILINDGSTDKTKAVIDSYTNALQNGLEEYLYLEKENGGAASAVNLALGYVKGTYMTWADADDVLAPENIALKAHYLDANLDKGMVVCQARAWDETTKNFIRSLEHHQESEDYSLFHLLLNGKVSCYAGVFMLRSELLWKRLINRRIYCHREVGKNWQLLLPVAYDHACGCLKEYLYDCYIRSDSHSRKTDYKKELIRTHAQEEVLRNILVFLPSEEKEKILKDIAVKYIKQRIKLSFYNKDSEEFHKNYNQLLQIDGITIEGIIKMEAILIDRSLGRRLFIRYKNFEKRLREYWQ